MIFIIEFHPNKYTEIIMKSVTESLVMKLFDKWKNKQLGKTAKKMMKDNPQLEKDMKTIAKTMDSITNQIKKGKNPFK